jgi:hypothetical protein
LEKRVSISVHVLKKISVNASVIVKQVHECLINMIQCVPGKCMIASTDIEDDDDNDDNDVDNRESIEI